MSTSNLLEDLAALSDRAASAREMAREDALTAIRHVEKALLEALGGEPLRGLVNLGLNTTPWYGARVRGSGASVDGKFTWPATPGARDYLCLAVTGELVTARCVTSPLRASDPAGGRGGGYFLLVEKVEASPVDNDDLVAEDLPGLLQTLRVVIPRHLEKAKATEASYLKISALAEKITAAVR
jgi:hypothetical protein